MEGGEDDGVGCGGEHDAQRAVNDGESKEQAPSTHFRQRKDVCQKVKKWWQTKYERLRMRCRGGGMGEREEEDNEERMPLLYKCPGARDEDGCDLETAWKWSEQVACARGELESMARHTVVDIVVRNGV